MQYQVCETGGFSLDGSSAIANTADTGIVCTTDYIDIQGKINFENILQFSDQFLKFFMNFR